MSMGRGPFLFSVLTRPREFSTCVIACSFRILAESSVSRSTAALRKSGWLVNPTAAVCQTDETALIRPNGPAVQPLLVDYVPVPYWSPKINMPDWAKCFQTSFLPRSMVIPTDWAKRNAPGFSTLTRTLSTCGFSKHKSAISAAIFSTR